MADQRAIQRPTAIGWMRANPLLVAGGLIALAVVLIAILAPLLAPSPGDAGAAADVSNRFLPPSPDHLFGTDQLGRDIMSRVIYGARVSPLIALVVIAGAVLIGLPMGLIAGYAGGPLDDVLMRVTDVFLALPPLLLAMAFATILPPSTTSTMIAITIAWWPWYARLVRGEAASVKNRRFIQSCRALGLSHRRILFRHVLPNSITPLMVQASLDFGGVILTASALSFLGLGAQPPVPDWGLMVSQGQRFFLTQWWMVTFPGLAILISALGFNLLGDGLRDVLSPRRSQELR